MSLWFQKELSWPDGSTSNKIICDKVWKLDALTRTAVIFEPGPSMKQAREMHSQSVTPFSPNRRYTAALN